MPRLVYGALVILTTFLMGSSFAVGKIGLTYMSPFLLVGIRFTLAGILFAIVVYAKKYPHPQSLKVWGQIALIGLFQTTGVMGLIFLSLQTITAGESSILTFMNPLLVVILARWLLKSRYMLRQWLGVLFGFIGVMITLGLQFKLGIGIVYAFLGAVSWSLATILIKKWGSHINVWVMTAYQMLAGGLVLLLAGVTLETPRLELTMTAVVLELWLVIMASIVQFAVWFYLLQHGDPGKTSAFLFLAPFFGVLSGWALLAEPITLHVVFGGILIFLGIFLVNWMSRAGAAELKRS